MLTSITKAILAPNAAIWASAKSTKITSRSITCKPQYVYIPANIKHVKNGNVIICTNPIIKCTSAFCNIYFSASLICLRL